MLFPNRPDDLPGETALLGVAGSHAFGLETSTSDIDYRGVFVVPTRDFFRLALPPESYSHKNPDIAMHEVGRFVRHAAAANPTALETLFYSEYLIKSPIGKMLLDNRWMFITDRIRGSHLGFAESQFQKMQHRFSDVDPGGDKRVAKHARHTLRVIRLTEKVLTTGDYDIRVDDRDEIFAFGEMGKSERASLAATEITRLREIDSVLPPAPDMKAIDELLVTIREMSL